MTSFGVAVATLTDGGFWTIAACTFVFLTGSGMSFPCVQVIALAPHSLAAPLVGSFGTASALPMGLAMGISLSIAVALLWIVVRPQRAAPSRGRASPNVHPADSVGS